MPGPLECGHLTVVDLDLLPFPDLLLELRAEGVFRVVSRLADRLLQTVEPELVLLGVVDEVEDLVASGRRSRSIRRSSWDGMPMIRVASAWP